MCLGLITPGRRSCLFGRVQQCARVRAACAQVCAHVCARSLGASGLGLRGAPQPGLPADWGGRAEPAGLRAGRAVRKRVPRGSLCVGVRLRAAGGHHFLLRSGQAHKREGGCRPSPSSFPQMPSAAGLLLQYGPRRLSPRLGGLPGCAALWPPSRLARPQTASSASLFV